MKVTLVIVGVYLTGCLAAAGAMAANLFCTMISRACRPADIFWYNVSKLNMACDPISGGPHLFNPASSWYRERLLNLLGSWYVAFHCWRFLFYRLRGTLRRMMTPISPQLWELRHSLFADKDLSPESVCTRLIALDKLSGGFDSTAIIWGLRDFEESVAGFSAERVLQELQRLNVVSADEVRIINFGRALHAR